MSPAWRAGVISLRAAVPLKAWLLEQNRTWHLHQSPDLQSRWAGISLQAGPKNMAQKLWHRRLVLKALGAAVPSHSWEQGKRQLASLLWLRRGCLVFVEVCFGENCIQQMWHRKCRLRTTLDEEIANPVLCRRYLQTSFGEFLLSQETWYRDQQPVDNVADVSLLGPSLA